MLDQGQAHSLTKSSIRDAVSVELRKHETEIMYLIRKKAIEGYYSCVYDIHNVPKYILNDVVDELCKWLEGLGYDIAPVFAENAPSFIAISWK